MTHILRRDDKLNTLAVFIRSDFVKGW